MKIILLTLLLTITAQAQVKVQVVDPDLDSSSLEKAYQVNRNNEPFNALPNKEARDELFKGSHSIKKWDELKKDIFYMDLKSKSLNELFSKYPEVSQSEMKSLKAKRE